VVPDLAGPLQLVERLEGIILPVSRCRRAVKLEQVQRLDAKEPEAPLDEGGEVLAVVALRGVGIQSAPGLGGDENFVVRAVLEEPPMSFSLRPSP
jgi:hypothetical protein